MPTTIAIASFQIPDCNFSGTTCKLRRYYDQGWQDVDGVPHVAGSPGSATDFFDEISCTITSNTISVPSFPVTPTVTGLVNSDVKETWQLWDQAGVARVVIAEDWFIPASPSAMTFGALQVLNQGQSLLWPESTYLNSKGVQDLIDAEVGTLNDASDVIKGRTYLDPAPLVSTAPTAVGTNNRRVSSCIYRARSYVGTDIQRIQAAVNAAKADGAGHVDFEAASYLIPTSILMQEIKGVGFHGAGNDNTKIIATGGQPAVQCAGIWRSKFEGIQFMTSAAIVGAAVFELDAHYNGVSWDMGVQGNHFDDCYFNGADLATWALAICRQSLGSGQGSENIFVNTGFISADTLVRINGGNAVNNTFIGGNFQDFLTGIYAENGVTCYKVAFQPTRGYAQIAAGGADIDTSAGGNVATLSHFSDSESLIHFKGGPGKIVGLTQRAGGTYTWAANVSVAANIVLISPTTGKLYRVTTPGVSAAVIPTFSGATVADGTAVWTLTNYTNISSISASSVLDNKGSVITVPGAIIIANESDQVTINTAVDYLVMPVGQQLILADATAGNIVITLPTYAPVGQMVTVKKIDTSAHTVSIVMDVGGGPDALTTTIPGGSRGFAQVTNGDGTSVGADAHQWWIVAASFGTFGAVSSVGALVSTSPSAGVGYATGAGGAVAQLTSKATGVTLNKVAGAVTTFNDALAAGAEVSFVVTNSAVAATDVPVVAIKSGGTLGAYDVVVSAVAAGSFTITISNLTAGSLSEALVLSFVVIKAVVA